MHAVVATPPKAKTQKNRIPSTPYIETDFFLFVLYEQDEEEENGEFQACNQSEKLLQTNKSIRKLTPP
jgi:hypothetical protein